MAAFNLPSLLAKLCVGRYFGSSFLLEAFLNSCSFELSLDIRYAPIPVPSAASDPLLERMKSMDSMSQ